MEHEYTISGRIFPEVDQVIDVENIKKFLTKITWAHQDFENIGFHAKLMPCELDEKGTPQKVIILFSMNNDDIDVSTLEQACLNLSMILGCSVLLCKDHEVYGVANVFNGGSDYEVVNEEFDLWFYNSGKKIYAERTNHRNEKMAALEQEYLQSDAAKLLLQAI
ncbi:hypothetical protein [Fibrobacter sp. UWEL]|uniref:hypothetical protein n=1 Tax=Fibrobacter sp. UWEL TaxID=1896209 RepID=UPI000911D0A3|nr:hypothetical protein [Fibrobacter sp. UWEL]SHK30028.1 hypothetical protein SAMN05720468_10131 [Fibrobacter sp. UWEL]